MALFIYGVAANTGKGFFTAEDRRNFFLRGYSGHDGSNYVDVWAIGANERELKQLMILQEQLGIITMFLANQQMKKLQELVKNQVSLQSSKGI